MQGCSVGCKRCLSQDTWAPDGGAEMSVGELADVIRATVEQGLDGVTITGGEPFDQPEALGALLHELAELRLRSRNPIDLLAYSGYPLRRLEHRHGKLLELLDGVIAGPYQQSKPTRLIWRGSANQEMVALTRLGRERYSPFQSYVPENPPVQVAVDDSIWFIGVPRDGDMPRLESLLKSSGVELTGVSWRS
ncbi:MAG: radical SAM protein [Gaiellaceae bacterium MAG52_C11]|nr:radical SAM protein [Candidatus Gaiellasilicea maunaloa]